MTTLRTRGYNFRLTFSALMVFATGRSDRRGAAQVVDEKPIGIHHQAGGVASHDERHRTSHD